MPVKPSIIDRLLQSCFHVLEAIPLLSGDLFRLHWKDINTRENQLKIIVRKTQQGLELPFSGDGTGEEFRRMTI